MTPVELARELKRRANEEGFEHVGIARAERLERDGARLEDWLFRGRHAGMGWMAQRADRRVDPRLVLTGCRSVVVVGMNHGPAEPSRPVDRAERPGRVARYARGRDYHAVIGRRLERLAVWLREASGQPARRFVDTAPVLERAWAERAGIGWIGKNANLLTRRPGSWLMLGEILAVAELAPHTGPHEEFCGNCTACLDACPTTAIVEPGVVDSTRCISYWTIEHRGAVPRERRAGNADWIFGCDVCQEVCPWNESFAGVPDADPFVRRDDLAALDPIEILEMDETTFRARYSGTPLMRAKWEGMRRNACIVLGNLARPHDVARLRRALEDDADPVVRGHAAWALGRVGDVAAKRALAAALDRESDPLVVEEIRLAHH